MDQDKRERWVQLCELASKEQDPEKLLRVVEEINRLLDEKNQRLRPQGDGSQKQDNQPQSH
jgi:hypothetical protein